MSAVAAECDGRRHFLEDVRPYLLCCSTDFPNCGYFYQRRPSSRGEGHLPKQPGGQELELFGSIFHPLTYSRVTIKWFPDN